MIHKLVAASSVLNFALANDQLFLAPDLSKEVSDADPFNWKEHVDTNKQPTIGIFTQTISDSVKKELPEFANYKSYIMVAYVNYMEAQGARVVPIINEEERAVTLDKIQHIDGVLYPGGGGDYYDVGSYVLDYIKKSNDEGHFYPAWGTCLGYEHLITYTADAGKKALSKLAALSVSLPLEFTVDPLKTRMFGDLGEKAQEFTTNDFTYNHHNWGAAPETFVTDKGLADFWTVTSTSHMPDGPKFVASIEAKNYPIFGTMFHPEKPSELWVDGYHINHSWESIQLQEHFSKLLVGMARANPNTYGAYADYLKHDISNYKILDSPSWGPVYVF